MDKQPRDHIDIGPQYKGDNPFAARMRFHQSWYRSKILEAPYGTGPKAGSTTWYGNMLTREDGERGMNFLDPTIFDVASRRLAEKRGAIDPFRLLCNMLSSQPMCFNLFGKLVDDLELATRLMQALLPGEIQAVTRVVLEYAPEPARNYLNDRTAFDAFVSYIRLDGNESFIGIETKLVEAFSAKEYRSQFYDHWTQDPRAPWLPDMLPSLQAKQLNQLWRDHLLAIAMSMIPGSRYTSGRFMVVYHPLDLECREALAAYKDLLKPNDTTFVEMPLDSLVELWNSAGSPTEQKVWLNMFSLRYLDLQASEDDFLAHKA